MMFGGVLDHIANLRHVKSIKTRVLRLNLVFRITKVVKQPFYSIGPKIISGCVLEDFANLRQVKRAKLVIGPECTISCYRSCEAAILLHWTQNDVWEYFSVSRKPSAWNKMQNLCYRPECTISENQSCEATILLNWTQNDLLVYFGGFR
jgi:hypothetical protein